MNSDLWKKIQEIFEAAVEQPESAREAFVREACAGNLSLYEEVKSLLAADVNVHSILEGVALDAVDIAEPVLEKDARVGRYRIEKQIGSGGMGDVYLAERDDGQFHQKVALKVIRSGFAGPHLQRRFQNERQILARLSHPNIARLLDGGVYREGQPYFTMEYVDGQPLDVYCNQRRLPIRERLQLFMKVCEGLQYAHRNLIIHRDLKPGNVMVTAAGDVKLLDFGIAKILSDEEAADGSAPVTQAGWQAMTPEYASPEQVRGEVITTASDVYSMGVILYELLSGRRPYDIANRSAAAIVEAICNTKAPRPSSQLRASTDGAGEKRREDIASDRASNIRRLRHDLSGDLDNICMKALRKSPEERYASVDQLMADVERYLEGETVEASGGAVRYRFAKFVQRHKVAVITTAVVFIMMIATVTFYTLRLADERDRARLEAQKASEISGFLVSLFEISDPSESRGETITARELLDAGAQRIERELQGQPEIRAEMMNLIGGVYMELGLFDEAIPLAEGAYRIQRDLHGERHPDVARYQGELGEVYRALGNYAAAESLITSALAEQRRFFPQGNADVATSCGFLAWLYNEQGRYDEAEPLYRESLALFEREFGKEHRQYPIQLNNLALLRHEKGDYQQAEPMFRESLALHLKVHGEEHPETATTLYNLAQVLRDQGKFTASDSMYRRALVIDQKLLGDEHPTVAFTLSSIAQLREQMGDAAGAEPLFRQALAIRRNALGDDHPQVGFSRVHLAGNLRILKQFDEAAALLDEAERIYRAAFSENHPEMVKIVYHRGVLLLAMGKLSEAEAMLLEANWRRREIYGEGHRLVGNVLMALSDVQVKLKKWAEAETTFLEARDIFGKLFGSDHKTVAAVLYRQGDMREQRGEYAAADSFYTLALDIQRRVLRKGHSEIARSLAARGRIAAHHQHWREAELLLQESLQISQRQAAPSAEKIAERATLLADVYTHLKEPQQAARYRRLAETAHTPR